MARHIRFKWWLIAQIALSLGICGVIGLQTYQRYTALSDIRSLAVSPDGTFLAAGHSNGKVTIWDPNTRKRKSTLRSDSGDVGKITISHDNQWIASAHREGNDLARIRVWSASTGALIDCLEPGESCTPVAFHPTKPWLAWVTKDETLALWDSAARKEVRRMALKSLRASSLAFSRDGSWLAIGVLDMEGVPDNEDVIAIWDIEKDQSVAVLKGHEGIVEELEFSVDGGLLASIATQDTLTLWNVAAWKSIRSITHRTWLPSSLSLKPDGERVSIGLGNGSVREYSVSEGSITQEWNDPRDAGSCRYVRYDPKGRFIAYSAGNSMVFRFAKN